jgi:hypothetical protein
LQLVGALAVQADEEAQLTRRSTLDSFLAIPTFPFLAGISSFRLSLAHSVGFFNQRRTLAVDGAVRLMSVDRAGQLSFQSGGIQCL